MTVDDRYEEARRRVKKKKEFYGNFFSWIFCSIFLFVVNILTSPSFLWAFFPFVGWGIGIAFHGFDVFGYPGMGSDWEERQVEEEMRRMNRSRGRLSSGITKESLELKNLEAEKDDKPYQDEDLV